MTRVWRWRQVKYPVRNVFHYTQTRSAIISIPSIDEIWYSISMLHGSVEQWAILHRLHRQSSTAFIIAMSSH